MQAFFLLDRRSALATAALRRADHPWKGACAVSAHGELDSRTKTALAQATARAAEAAPQALEPLPVSNTANLRDLASAAAGLFGWNDSGVRVNANQALVIAQEQLEQIRQLREDPYKEPASEGFRKEDTKLE